MKSETLGFAAAIGIWLVYVLGCVALSVGAICVAIHFIRKFW